LAGLRRKSHSQVLRSTGVSTVRSRPSPTRYLTAGVGCEVRHQNIAFAASLQSPPSNWKKTSPLDPNGQVRQRDNFMNDAYVSEEFRRTTTWDLT